MQTAPIEKDELLALFRRNKVANIEYLHCSDRILYGMVFTFESGSNVSVASFAPWATDLCVLEIKHEGENNAN